MFDYIKIQVTQIKRQTGHVLQWIPLLTNQN